MTIRITIRPDNNIPEPVQDGVSNDYILTIPITVTDRTNTRIIDSNDSSRILTVCERTNLANRLNSDNIHNIKIKSSKTRLFQILSLIALKDKEKKLRGANPSIFEISFDNINYSETPGQKAGLTWTGNDLTLDLNDFNNPLNSDDSLNVEKVININDYELDANPIKIINNYNDQTTDLKNFHNLFANNFEKNNTVNLNTNNIYNLLKEYRKWVKIGFTKVEEILQANANGFILENTLNFRTGTTYTTPTLFDTDLTNTNIISNKKYKGFSLTEGATINTSAVTGNGYASDGTTQITTRTLSIDDKDVNATPGIYTKWHIDALRSINEEANANTVNDNQAKKDFFKNFGDPNKTASKDLWGFKPGDVVLTGTGPKYSVNPAGVASHDLKSYDSMDTKKGFEIQDFATGKLDEFLDLVFFDNDFEEVSFEYVPKVDMTNPADWTNDLTNKVSNKSELLDRYFRSAKLNHNYYTPYISPAVPDTNTKAIEDAYKEVKEILEAIEGKYSKDDKEKAQTAKNILEPASKNTKFKNGSLKTEITYKLTESEVALNDDIKFAEDNKIEEAKQDKSETAKALLEKAKKKITETQLTKLLEVIDWLEKANAATDETNYDEDALLKIWDIKISTEADEKAVWEKVVKDFKEKDDDKTWVEKGLEKLEGILTNAKNVAKNLIDEIKKDDPYNASGIDNLTSIININEIKDLFKLCHDAYQLQKRESNDKIFNALKLKRVANNSDWTTVNNYKKNGKDEDENEGYAAGALKYLQEFVEKELRQHSKILAITNEEELEKVLEEISASLEDTQKEEFDKMKTPMYRGRLKLLDTTTDEEKELKELLGLNYDQYKEDTRDNLNAIEDKISKLKAYENASETDKKGEAVKKAGGDILKSALTLFIEKMEDKKNSMRSIVEEVEKRKGNDQVPSESEWKNWHKIALAGVALTILAVAVYFLKRNSSEEGE